MKPTLIAKKTNRLNPDEFDYIVVRNPNKIFMATGERFSSSKLIAKLKEIEIELGIIILGNTIFPIELELQSMAVNSNYSVSVEAVPSTLKAPQYSVNMKLIRKDAPYPLQTYKP